MTSELEANFHAILSEVSSLMTEAYAKAGAVDGLKDGSAIVLDYLTHNEPGIALEHLVYMIEEPALAISPPCRLKLNRIREILNLPLTSRASREV